MGKRRGQGGQLNLIANEIKTKRSDYDCFTSRASDETRESQENKTV